MTNDCLSNALQQELSTSRAALRLEQAKHRRPALQRLERFSDVGWALGSDSLSVSERNAITHAMLLELRSSEDTVWASALCLGYHKMIAALARRLCTESADESIQIAQLSFLRACRTDSAITSVKYTRLQLVNRMRQFAFEDVRRQMRVGSKTIELTEEMEGDAALDPEQWCAAVQALSPKLDLTDVDPRYQAAVDKLDVEDVVLHTLILGETPQHYARRTGTSPRALGIVRRLAREAIESALTRE